MAFVVDDNSKRTVWCFK